METHTAPRADRECPFLVPVMADRLWLFPVGGYCRSVDGRVRVPARSTLTCICSTPAHLLCPGYLRRSDQPAAPPTESL